MVDPIDREIYTTFTAYYNKESDCDLHIIISSLQRFWLTLNICLLYVGDKFSTGESSCIFHVKSGHPDAQAHIERHALRILTHTYTTSIHTLIYTCTLHTTIVLVTIEELFELDIFYLILTRDLTFNYILKNSLYIYAMSFLIFFGTQTLHDAYIIKNILDNLTLCFYLWGRRGRPLTGLVRTKPDLTVIAV